MSLETITLCALKPETYQSPRLSDAEDEGGMLLAERPKLCEILPTEIFMITLDEIPAVPDWESRSESVEAVATEVQKLAGRVQSKLTPYFNTTVCELQGRARGFRTSLDQLLKDDYPHEQLDKLQMTQTLGNMCQVGLDLEKGMRYLQELNSFLEAHIAWIAKAQEKAKAIVVAGEGATDSNTSDSIALSAQYVSRLTEILLKIGRISQPLKAMEEKYTQAYVDDIIKSVAHTVLRATQEDPRQVYPYCAAYFARGRQNLSHFLAEHSKAGSATPASAVSHSPEEDDGYQSPGAGSDDGEDGIDPARAEPDEGARGAGARLVRSPVSQGPASPPLPRAAKPAPKSVGASKKK